MWGGLRLTLSRDSVPSTRTKKGIKNQHSLGHSPAAFVMLHSPAAHVVLHCPAALVVLHSPAAFVVLHSPAALVVLHCPAALVRIWICTYYSALWGSTLWGSILWGSSLSACLFFFRFGSVLSTLRSGV